MVGLIAAFIAVATHRSTEGIYVGIIEKDVAMGTGRDGLHVRAYVDETLVQELPAPSRLNGRMLIRETNMSVPLMFVRVRVLARVQSSRQRRRKAGTTPFGRRYPRLRE